MSEYIEYQHVEKLGTTETECIEIGDCYIFPKIDGTNAHIWLDDDKVIHCGSRKRELTLEKDNQGFMEYIMSNQGYYINLLVSLPRGAHVFGEWLVPHSLKTYRENAWRRFYIFDVMLSDGSYMHYCEYSKVFNDLGYEDFIPPLRVLKNPKPENIERCLEENSFLVAEGSGEGIVIKNYGYKNQYGRTCWAKVVTTEFKAKHARMMGAPYVKCSDHIEESIVDTFLTEEIPQKVKANIENECGGWSSKYIPRLLHTVYHDFVTECTWEAIKKNKYPKIDFKLLKRFVDTKTKALLPEVF